MTRKGTKKFSGKTFKYAGHESTKREANIHAERIRSRGNLARVDDSCAPGYCIYRRKAKKGAKKARRAKKHTKSCSAMKRAARLYPYDI